MDAEAIAYILAVGSFVFTGLGLVHSLRRLNLRARAAAAEHHGLAMAVADRWRELHAPEAVAELVRDMREIDEVTLLDFKPQPALEKRLVPLPPPLRRLWNEARRLRNEENIPFYDALTELAREKGMPEKLLSDVFLYHEGLSPDVPNRSVQEVDPSLIRQRASALGRGRALGMGSPVRLRDGSEAHIPMLDLRWPTDARSVHFAQALLAELQLGGLLLNSGKSFHFYGSRLLSPEEHRIFLGRALLLGTMVDRRWIGHQLMNGATLLRLTSAPGTDHDKEPQVVAEIPPANHH